MFLLAAPIATEDLFAVTLGVAVAVLVVGSAFLLRWQRNRQRFELTRLALENGATQFPQGPPFWLVSLREAVSTLALGLGLLAVGAISYGMGSRIPAPTNEQLRAAALNAAAQSRPAAEPADRRPPRPRGPEEADGPLPERRPLPPVPIPALEQWHRGQAMQNVGLLAMGCGGVLTLLGLVRAGFARVERGYAGGESPAP